MNDTVPTPPADTCTLDWCTNRRGHRDNHLRVVGVVEPTAWSYYSTVLVTVECGRGQTDPLPVLTLVGEGKRGSVRMEWPEAATVADLLAQAAEDHDPDAIVQRRVRGNVAPVEVHTDRDADEWQHALTRLGASGTIEMTGCAVIIEHDDGVNETLRLHAPARTETSHVREVVRDAARALGIV